MYFCFYHKYYTTCAVLQLLSFSEQYILEMVPSGIRKIHLFLKCSILCYTCTLAYLTTLQFLDN